MEADWIPLDFIGNPEQNRVDGSLFDRQRSPTATLGSCHPCELIPKWRTPRPNSVSWGRMVGRCAISPQAVSFPIKTMTAAPAEQQLRLWRSSSESPLPRVAPGIASRNDEPADVLSELQETRAGNDKDDGGFAKKPKN
jgi:hypothetical protein